MLFVKNIVWILFLNLANYSSGIEKKWLDTFIRYLKVDARVYQVFFMLTENKIFHPIIQETTEKITNNFPSRKISYSEATIMAKDLFSTSSFFNPKTSLFVMILSALEDKNLPELIDLFEFVNELSKYRSRPKCLIIILRHEKHQYKSLLRLLWFKQFLDVTILELVKLEIKDKNYFLEYNEEDATLYYLNPFTDKIEIQNQNKYYQSAEEMSFFPNKLLNLYGYQIKVAYINSEPEVFLKRNESGHIIDSFGPMVLKIENLAEHMNFSLWIHPNITTRGNFTCNKNDSTDMYHSLRNNEIQLTVIEFGRFSSCDQYLYEWSKGIGKHHMLLVVPFLPAKSSKLSNNWKTWNGIIVFILPSFVWILSHLFHFDALNWHFINLIQMMFGLTIPQEPRNRVERIFFILTLWAFFVYSSFIYTVFTSINVQIDITFRFENVEEVIDSELKPMIGGNFHRLMYPGSDGSVQSLLKKATKERSSRNISSRNIPSSKICMMRLIGHKNVACIEREDHIEMILRETKDNCGHPVVKVMNNHLDNTLSATVLEPGSPYVKPIDDFIQRMEESGITKKWWMTYFFNQSTTELAENPSCVKNKLEYVQVIKQGIPLLIFGYGFAVIAFFGEVIISFIVKLIHR